MPRHARKKSSIQTYHVVIKGADRQLLFEDTKDYLKYLDILEVYKQECQFELYAYCLMSNHVHLLIHTTSTPLETIFRKINTTYACWFNLKYNRTGYLWSSFIEYQKGISGIADTEYVLEMFGSVDKFLEMHNSIPCEDCLDINKYIILLHQKGLSVRQLNRLTGTPRGIIERTISKKNHHDNGRSSWQKERPH